MSALQPFNPEHQESAQSKVWITFGLFLLLAVLIHLLVFMARIEWTQPLAPAPVELQEISPEKLDALRKQWKAKEKSFLLEKDKNSELNEKEAPPDARYMSEHNRRVEKEQRARQTQVLPKPGGPRTQQRPQEKKQAPALKQLGIPFKMDGRAGPGAAAGKVTAQRQQELEQMEEGGDQAILEKNLPEGSENLLNTQESVYYSFYARLYESIAPIWQSRVREVPYRSQIMPGEYVTQVDVIVDREGNLIGVNLLHASGIPEFDRAVDDAWHKIQRFPNPPRGLLNKDRQVHMGWTFSVSVGQGSFLDYPPPQRRY